MFKFKSLLLPFSFVVLFSFAFDESQAQRSTSSLYSQYGLGDLQTPGFSRNLALGGLSTVLSSPNGINIGNPASYSSIDLTTFEAGVTSNFVKLKAMDNSVPAAGTNTTNVRYIAFAFPLSRKWGASIGLVPFSYVGYDIGYTQSSSIGPVHHYYKGTGGINQFYLGNGFKVTKNLSLGINVSYLFGNITKQKSIAFDASSNALNSTSTYSTNVGDFYFDGGAIYNFNLPKDHVLSLGITGALKRNMNTLSTLVFQQYADKNGTGYPTDTSLLSKNVKGGTLIPGTISGGVSYKKSGVWMLGVDYKLQDWSGYKSYGVSDSLTNSSKIILGGEYIRNQIQYRVGCRYEETYFQINRVHINEVAVSAGMGIPLSRGFSYINIAAELAERGALSNSLIREHYLRLMVGLTMSDRWFIKRKFD
jgi:hypothetical protein